MTRKVLIVDDTEINVVLFAALVKKLGDCEVKTFYNSPEGLAWARINEIEADWERAVGATDYATFRTVLERLGSSR